MKRTILLFIGILLAASSTYAQDIFKKHGYNKEMLTLSKGRYKETFINEDVVQIGTVLINTRTDKVITFLEEDTTGLVYKAESTSSFLTMDPLAEKYPEISPYVYCMNNPINLIDPTGMAPIYDPDGNFLGTDDLGLQGNAIIMSTENFSQGMAHKEAYSYYRDMNNEDAYKKLDAHYNNLPNRPDYDGELTLGEANDWYRNGNGEPLYVDAAKIDLSPVTTKDLTLGEAKFVNFASPSYANTATGLVYGNIKLTLINETGMVKLGGEKGLLDNYGFEMHKGGSTFRNIATKIGKVVAGSGTTYDIFNYNNGQIKVKK